MQQTRQNLILPNFTIFRAHVHFVWLTLCSKQFDIRALPFNDYQINPMQIQNRKNDSK